jgi:catalase
LRGVTDVAKEAIRAIDETAGRHDGYRVVHAKGVLCRGTFVATPEARRLTRAPHMQGDEVPVTVRFSNASGNPRSPDHARDARGMATKLYLPDGGRTDIVAVTLPCFFVRRPEDFIAFTRATKPLPRFVWYVVRHREAWRAAAAAVSLKPPVSYATCSYNAVHAFRWTAADGTERFVRYTWVPAAGMQSLGQKQAKRLGGDYLQREIPDRLARGPIRFTLSVQVAAAGDPTDDATAVWPEDRERLDVGTLQLTALDTDREREGDVLVFDPTRVTEGIDLSTDPLLPFRSRAYSISVERRSGVARPAELD